METEIETIPMNKVYFGKSEKTVQYLATISVCFAAVSAGTVLGWSSPVISELAASEPLNCTSLESHECMSTIHDGKNQTDTPIKLTKSEQALLGSILNVGALVYAIPTGYIADKYGRKISIYLTAFSFLLGWLFVVFAWNVAMLLIARLLGGMGLGAICVVAPIYIGEIAEYSTRATLSSYFQIFLSFGVFITFAVGAVTDYIKMSIVLATFPVLLLITFPFMPETHVHLMKVGKTKKAEQSLIRFRGKNAEYDIKGELEIIKQEINRTKHKSATLGDIISRKANRNGMIAVLGMLAFQQLCGINAITFYAEQIFKEANAGFNSSVGAIIMGGLQCVGGYLGMLLINKAGRKYFLILSSVGMMIGLFVLAVFFQCQRWKWQIAQFSFLPIVCTALFIVAFTLAYGSIPYMMIHELLSPEIRGIGGGIAIVVCWGSSFLVTYAFPLAMASIGNYMTFYIMAFINAIAIIFVLFFVPETRGKTLIEIQEFLGK